MRVQSVNIRINLVCADFLKRTLKQSFVFFDKLRVGKPLWLACPAFGGATRQNNYEQLLNYIGA